MEDTQHRFGSIARYPHSSSRLNPLNTDVRLAETRKLTKTLPHAKHVNQVLLCNIILLIHVPLEGCEYILLLE